MSDTVTYKRALKRLMYDYTKPFVRIELMGDMG